MSRFEHVIAFPERCLLATFHALKLRDIRSDELNSSIWIRMASESGFLDVNTIGLDFAVILVLCMDQQHPIRVIAETRLVDAEGSRSGGFDAGRTLISLTELLPRALTCLPQLKLGSTDYRAKSVISSALLESYGREAIRFLSRFFRIHETDVIYEKTVGESWSPSQTIRITPVSWIAKVVRGFQFRPESFPANIRAMVYAQLFREIPNNETFLCAAEQASGAETTPDIVDEKEEQFLRACYEALDIHERLLLFSIVYGGMSSIDAAEALNRAANPGLDNLAVRAPSEIETAIVDLWKRIFFH